MKTTEQISLGGFAFTVESDAYVVLESYLEEIKECFRSNESADEIVEDIEVHIAEILKEKYVDGTVINMAMVNEVKTRIGDPKELCNEDEAEKSEAEESASQPKKCIFKDRRLYRDIDDRTLGGVCSGLGQYFNIDKVIFRVFFLIAFCLGFFEVEDGLFSLSILLYLILWIAVPAARTVEQKCEMKSKPKDLREFRSNGNSFSREIKEVAKSPAVSTVFRIFITIVGIILLLIGLGGLFITVFMPSVPAMIQNFGDISMLSSEELLAMNTFVNDPTFWWMCFGVSGIGSLGIIYAGIVLCFNLKTPSWRPGLIIFLLWLMGSIATAAWIIHKGIDLAMLTAI